MRRRRHQRAPQSSAIAARIPPELLLAIFAHLQPAAPDITHDPPASRQFVASVAAMPLVCTKWREAGTEALYRFIDITFASPRACARLIKTLERNQSLTALVHGLALPGCPDLSYIIQASNGVLSMKANFLSARSAPIDIERVHNGLIALCAPLAEVHFPAHHTTQAIVDSGALSTLRRARVGFGYAGRAGVPVVPHLRHVASLQIAHNNGTLRRTTQQPYYLNGLEQLTPPRLSSISALHLANLVMPVAQWNALLAAVRKSLKHLMVHLFTLALEQGDGRDLLLPDDLLPIAATLEELEVGTVLRPPGALHILPHIHTLSLHVAFPTVLPPPRSLPRALERFRIVDGRRAGSDTWAWALARYVLTLLRSRPPKLHRLEILTWLTDWRELREWDILASVLHKLSAAVGVTLRIDLQVAQSLTDAARKRWAAIEKNET